MWILSDGYLHTVLLDGLKRQMSKAFIDRSDSLIFQHKRRPSLRCFRRLAPSMCYKIQNTKYKKIYFGFTYASSEVHFRSTERKKHFIGQLWQLMTASNVGARTQAWQAKWVVFKIPGFVCKRFLPFFPTPPCSFTYAVVRAVFSPVNLGIFEAQHQTNCNRIVFNAI